MLVHTLQTRRGTMPKNTRVDPDQSWHEHTTARWLSEDGLSTIQIARNLSAGRGLVAFLRCWLVARSVAYCRGWNL